MNLSVYLTGLGAGLSLIVAIGAQNAFVLRQGLRREHVAAVCFACALSDAVLIAVGVAAFGTVAAVLPALDPAMRLLGAGFLGWYGARSLRAAIAGTGTLAPAEDGATGLARTLGVCLALTWLNPHVYLDTVVLLGTIAAQYPGARAEFAAGAVTGSFAFFFGLGYGARALRPVFARPAAWRLLDGAIAATMWTIALGLIRGL